MSLSSIKNIFNISVFNQWWDCQPPKLDKFYTQADYHEFMREEISLFTPRYVKNRVEIVNKNNLVNAVKHRGAVLAPLHYGSYFLTGCAITQQTNVSCNAIVTYNNLEVLTKEEADFWRFAHRQTSKLQRQNIFYAGRNARQEIVEFLQKPRKSVWAMLDVREVGRYRPEFPFLFQGKEVHLQIGAARLAIFADVPLIPVCIQYSLNNKKHYLHIGTPICSNTNPIEMTQAALIQHEKMINGNNAQFFHDMEYFSVPMPVPNATILK